MTKIRCSAAAIIEEEDYSETMHKGRVSLDKMLKCSSGGGLFGGSGNNQNNQGNNQGGLFSGSGNTGNNSLGNFNQGNMHEQQLKNVIDSFT